MGKKTTVAVITTYNRRGMLLRLLERLKTMQLLTIIIIDNSEYASLLTSEMDGVIYIKTTQNIGGAGGYNLGMKEAVKINPDFIWLLDDDSVPEMNSLENMLEAYENLVKRGRVAYLCSTVLWGNSEDLCVMNIPTFSKGFNQEDKYSKRIQSCSFVSMLIPLANVYQVGLPIKEFFIWYDDVDYAHRLNTIGIAYQVCNSVVRHYTEENKGANFQYISKKNIYKYKYGIRNMVSHNFRRNKFRFLIRLLFRIHREMSVGRVDYNLRLNIFFWYIKGLFFCPKVESI